MPDELAGRTILITRTPKQARSMARAVEERGGRALCIPTIEIAEPADWSPVDEAIARLQDYDGVLFTSANAARRFLERVRDVSRLPAAYSVGKKTSAVLRELGVSVSDTASVQRAEGLLASLADVSGKRFLLPRAEQAREVLPETLRERGAEVDVVTVYRTVPARDSAGPLAEALAGGVDCATFLSGSAVRAFVDLIAGEIPADVRIAVIGPVTAEEATAAGLTVDVVADEPSAEQLIAAISRAFSGT